LATETYTRIISDLDGREIPEERAVKVTLTMPDKTTLQLDVDIADHEIQPLIKNGKPPAKKSRRRRKDASVGGGSSV
jgi:hypothetical protein